MKTIFLTTFFLLALCLTNVNAASVTCTSKEGTQWGDKLPAMALLTFELERKGTESTIEKLNGFVFVKNQFEDDGDTTFNEENSYRGYFEFDAISANSNYRPLKYKGHIQFKNFDAKYTDGLESGMWGSFVIEPKEKEFKAYYIFQAGDHIGGTLQFTCAEK